MPAKSKRSRGRPRFKKSFAYREQAFTLGCVLLLALSSLAWSYTGPARAVQSVVVVKSEVEEDDLGSLLDILFGRHSKPSKIVVHYKGTGFAIGNKIYTCEHVIHGARKITVTLRNGDDEIATLVRSDEKTDLAELAVPWTPPPLVLRDYPPRFGERVCQIGNPGPLNWVVSFGRFVSFIDGDNIFLLDTFGGNSGSPIMDTWGQVVGMTHALIPGTRFTFGGSLQDLQNFLHPQAPQ